MLGAPRLLTSRIPPPSRMGRVADGGQADMRCGVWLTRPASCRLAGERTPTQRRPMRMIHLDRLVLVDLPVDVVVVLEQQE